MGARILWSGWFRVPFFWIVVCAVVAACDGLLPGFDLALSWRTFIESISKGVTGQGQAAAEAVSKPEFATSLAFLLGASGLGLLVAFLTLHAIAVRISLAGARRRVERFKDRQAFAQGYEAVYQKLLHHPLIGHAWKEFDETLLKNDQAIDGVIGNTVRPQSFIGYQQAREKLTGLKMLGSISGYFVGIGLLLTFIGIVLALGTAGSALNQSSADKMMPVMKHLLEIASFKFTTSIAGLGVSIVFAIFARIFVVWIEGGFNRFCEAVENQLRYTAPQSITAQMNATNKEQLDQLKEINSDKYFTRLADKVAPLIEQAMRNAIAPMTEGVGVAVQQSAGKELRELGNTLGRLDTTLGGMQTSIQGTGEDFTRRMSEAAENLNRLVAEAGSGLAGGAADSRAALQEVVATLKDTFQQANGKLASDLGSAATGASAKVEEAMARVLGGLETQMGTLMKVLQNFQMNAAENVAATQKNVADAQNHATTAISGAAGEAAKALQAGLGDALQQITSEVDRFSQAMASGATAYGQQATAIGDATSQTRQVADAFARTAQDVRSASAPLLQTGERMATASSEMSQSIARAARGLETTNVAATTLSTALGEQVQRLGDMWEGYKQQFDKVDEDLGNAVKMLGEQTEGQSERMAGFARRMDAELAKAMDRLIPAVEQVGNATAELSDTLGDMVKLQGRGPVR